MRISQERLSSEAKATGFRAELLEKVFHLLGLLEGFQSHPFLRGRFALKGGTALNLFYFDLPRLSVDIDLNYVGAAERAIMLDERPRVETAIQAVCEREGFSVRRIPDEHAGGKWSLRYQSALGQGADLQLDLNYMFRVPLWPVVARDSCQIGSYQIIGIPVCDIHELAAGKLAALLSRHQVRDLFDSHLLLRSGAMVRERLRTAFVVFGAMNRRDWRTVSLDDVIFDKGEIENRLRPLLSKQHVEVAESSIWGTRLVEGCREALQMVLPFAAAEQEFLDRLLDRGEIAPMLLTDDEALAKRIARHPMLEWKALNVRRQQST